MDESLNITFYFPYMEDSGVPVLFYRMANSLAKENSDLRISVIDYENGVMARNLLKLPNLVHIKFEPGKEVTLPTQSILVMQSFVPYYWPKELVLKSYQRLFFWNLHPQNLVPSLLPVPYLRDIPFNNFGVYKFMSNFYPELMTRLREFIKVLIKHKALYFMDSSNLNYTSKYLFHEIEAADFIPVPAEFNINHIDVEDPILEGDILNVGWVGRLCDFKSYILVYTINKLAEIATQITGKKIVFHIVGDGPFMQYIKDNITPVEHIAVIFHGSIAHDKLDEFICKNIDVLTAMGTSALEGAKLAKPTILLDFTFNKVKKDYVFRMLHETKKYDLAHLITEEDFNQGNNSLLDIMKGIISDYGLYAKKAKLYFAENHDIKIVQNIFLDKVQHSTLEYSMINPELFKKGSILQFYNKIRGLDN